MGSRGSDGLYCRVRKRIGRLLSGIHVCLRNIGRTVRRIFYTDQETRSSDFDIESSVPSSSSAITVDGFPAVVKSESYILDFKDTKTKITDVIAPEKNVFHENENAINVPSPIERHKSLPVKLSFQNEHKTRSFRFKTSLLRMVRFSRLTKSHRRGNYAFPSKVNKSNTEPVVRTKNFKKICSGLDLDLQHKDSMRPTEAKRNSMGRFSQGTIDGVCEPFPNESEVVAYVNMAPGRCGASSPDASTDYHFPAKYDAPDEYFDHSLVNNCVIGEHIDPAVVNEASFTTSRNGKFLPDETETEKSAQLFHIQGADNCDTGSKDEDTVSNDSLLCKWLELMKQHGHKGIGVITPREKRVRTKKQTTANIEEDEGFMVDVAEPGNLHPNVTDEGEMSHQEAVEFSDLDVSLGDISDFGDESSDNEERLKEFTGTGRIRNFRKRMPVHPTPFKNDEAAEVQCPFGIGTHYRMDDRIDTQRCKRGAKIEQNIKQKVKRRGIPNKHLALNTATASAYLNPQQAGVEPSLSSERISPCHVKSEVEIEAQPKVQRPDCGDETKGDTRHMDFSPAFVITKKKQEEDAILQQYTVPNKNKQRGKTRKKKQRNAPATSIFL